MMDGERVYIRRVLGGFSFYALFSLWIFALLSYSDLNILLFEQL